MPKAKKPGPGGDDCGCDLPPLGKVPVLPQKPPPVLIGNDGKPQKPGKN